jgi:hypothetical protein
MKNHTYFLSVLFVGPDNPKSTLAACYIAPGGDDTNACTAKGAPCETIQGALDKPGCTDVLFVAIGTYTGTGNDPVVTINKSIQLTGGWDASFTPPPIGTSTIDGENARRGMEVKHGATAFIEQFTITNGEGDGSAGIYNEGNLTLFKCSVRDNIDTDDWTSEGGGIRNGSGTLTIKNSTIRDNQSSSGAGIFNAWGTLIVTNSTISGNSARGTGGGINNLGGEVYLNNATITGNTDNSDSGEQDASGIHNEAFGEVYLKNTILANNTGQDCDGTMNSAGYNLIEDSPVCIFTPMDGDRIDVDPQLGSLQDNGGLTTTHALLFGSPAINAGEPGGCKNHQGSPLNSDQRFFSRVQRCDIGAFEFQTYLYQTVLPFILKAEH